MKIHQLKHKNILKDSRKRGKKAPFLFYQALYEDEFEKHRKTSNERLLVVNHIHKLIFNSQVWSNSYSKELLFKL